MAKWGCRSESDVYLDTLRALLCLEYARMTVLHLRGSVMSRSWKSRWLSYDSECRQKRQQLRILSRRVGVGLL